MIKYEVIVYWSKEDDCFVSEMPELPGCMADGQSKQEAVNNLERVAEEWLETARELAAPFPNRAGV